VKGVWLPLTEVRRERGDSPPLAPAHKIKKDLNGSDRWIGKTVNKKNRMEIILIQDVDNLGAAHEKVSVKNGYGRNYLIPRKLAVEANPSNLKQLDERVKQLKKKEAKLMAEVNKVIEVLKASPLKIGAKTGTSGKIFGSVTSVQLARAIRDQKGYEIDRRRIQILDEVKELGTFKANVDFGNGNEAEVEFEVSAE
jgi:large subunit ribosomal protein L9